MLTSTPAFSSAPAPSERLSGSVERVTFHSEESGFCVLKIKAKGHRDLVTITGSAATIGPGEFIEAKGQWINDRNYGLQFKSDHLRAVPPTTLDGIEKYLGSGMVKGVGPHFAKKLVSAFGESVFDVIENEPQRMLELEGIGKKRMQKVVAAWAEQRAIREIMTFLQSHGVGTSRAVKIYKTYGDDAILKVTENPYRLADDIYGIGFKTADTVAQKIGIAADSPLRARAGVKHVLSTWSEQGHCAAPREKLVSMAAGLLSIREDIIDAAINDELEKQTVIAEKEAEGELIFLTPLHRSEQGCAAHLKRLMDGELPWGRLDPKKMIPWIMSKTGLSLSDSQQSAIAKAIANKVMIITGGPGVGKTTIVNSVLGILRRADIDVTLCAPTGRAAKRMTETTGLPAKTVHSLLEFDPKTMGFRRNRDNPLETQFLVIDEASMMDVVLMNQLLRSVPDDAGVLIVGDVDQLPSVGPGSVLSDLIESGEVPTARLTEIFRQAAGSKIITNAHRINRGQLPISPERGEQSDFYLVPAKDPEDLYDKLIKSVMDRIPNRFGFDPINDVQILSPMNRGGLGVHSLNVELQKLLNPNPEVSVTRYGTTFAPGDKVIQMKNDYTREVFNGDIGKVHAIDSEESKLLIDFDDRLVEYDYADLDEVSLAYATSIHKSQGSEYPCVVIPVSAQHYMLLERNLLYTAVTRGKQLVVLLAEPKALSMAVNNRKSNRRITRLSERLAAEDPEPYFGLT